MEHKPATKDEPRREASRAGSVERGPSVARKAGTGSEEDTGYSRRPATLPSGLKSPSRRRQGKRRRVRSSLAARLLRDLSEER
jgi:hypothetical protein